MAIRRTSAKTAGPRTIRCYLCGHVQEVSARAMSTNCPGCHKAIRIEDFIIKSYVPVNDLQTCGKIVVTKKGRVAAKRIHSGEGIECEGILHGAIECLAEVVFQPKAEWKGPVLRSKQLVVNDGANIDGRVFVPWGAETIPADPRPPATRPASPIPR